jgi:hypothetical protein
LPLFMRISVRRFSKLPNAVDETKELILNSSQPRGERENDERDIEGVNVTGMEARETMEEVPPPGKERISEKKKLREDESKVYTKYT